MVVRLTTTPNAEFPPGTPPQVLLPESWKPDTYVVAGAFERLAQSSGSWTAVPLLFDVWGRTVFLKKGAVDSAPTDGAAVKSSGKAHSVAMAGSRPSFRQWALWDFADPVPVLSTWFNQAPEAFAPELKKLADGKYNALWVENTWDWSQNDLHQAYRDGSSLVFVETFHDWETFNATGIRSFAPFVKKTKSGTSISGLVLFAEVRSGSSGDWREALPVLRLVSDPAFQGKAATALGWLAANLNAPELDGTGARIRVLTSKAQTFIPLTDRLPDPLVEGNLAVAAQLAIDRVPKKN
jgi:hypothetical protein